MDSEVRFPKISVLWIFLLDHITFGIYPCFWFWRFNSILEKDSRFKSMMPPRGLFLTPPVALAVVLITSILETHFGGSLEQYSPKFWFNIATIAARWIFLIAMLALAFKGCDLLSYYFKIFKKTDVKCSKIFTFFLNHIYLQYKINKFADEPPGPAWLEPNSLRKIFVGGILLLLGAIAVPILWISPSGILGTGIVLNKPPLVRFGLVLGAPINPKDDKAPPLSLVCASLKVKSFQRDKLNEILQMLLARGADVNRGFKTGHSPLMSAVGAGDVNITELLLVNGADPNKITMKADNDDPVGTTALMIAAKTGNTQIAKILFEKGAQINLKNESNKSALTIASEANHADMVAFLKSVGAVDETVAGAAEKSATAGPAVASIKEKKVSKKKVSGKKGQGHRSTKKK